MHTASATARPVVCQLQLVLGVAVGLIWGLPWIVHPRNKATLWVPAVCPIPQGSRSCEWWTSGGRPAWGSHSRRSGAFLQHPPPPPPAVWHPAVPSPGLFVDKIWLCFSPSPRACASQNPVLDSVFSSNSPEPLPGAGRDGHQQPGPEGSTSLEGW